MGNILLPCTLLLIQIDKVPCLLTGNIYTDSLQLETSSNQIVFFWKAKQQSAMYRKVLKKTNTKRNLQFCCKSVFCFKRKGNKIPDHCFYRIFITLCFVKEAKLLLHLANFSEIHHILVYHGTSVSVITPLSEMRYCVIKVSFQEKWHCSVTSALDVKDHHAQKMLR